MSNKVRGVNTLKRLLSGGDRRSIARSSGALELIWSEPTRIRDLVALSDDEDWLVSMRALDLLEKLAREDAASVQRYRRVFIGPLADSDKWEVRLQIVRALLLLRWTTGERLRVIRILRQNVDHPQTFVRAWALDGLATFARQDGRLLPGVRRLLGEFERSESKALRARAKHIRARLGSG